MFKKNADLYNVIQLPDSYIPKGYIFYEYSRLNLFKNDINELFSRLVHFFGIDKELLVKDWKEVNSCLPFRQPLYLYINIPFCRKKCSFCHYITYPAGIYKNLFDDYISSLKREMEILFAKAVSYKKPVFAAIGGGTPLILSCRQLDKLCRNIYRYSQGKAMNVSFETTVGELLSAAGEDKIRILRQWGVNRLSVGVQTFDDNLLRKLGLGYSSQDAYRAISFARKAGFEHINVDCMFGFSFGGEIESWEKTSRLLQILLPESISLYQFRQDSLKFGKFRFFSRRGYNSVLNERLVINQDLTNKGYIRCGRHYSRGKDIFAKEKPIHDWMVLEGDWLACGVNARSTFAGRGYCNTRKINYYISSLRRNKIPVVRRVRYSLDERQKQFIIKNLAYNHGIDKKDFLRLFGYPLQAVFDKKIQFLTEKKIFLPLAGKSFIRKEYKPFELEIINYLCREYS
jgi:oxygen-independent coproporphyrinogen-3 oxidase